VGGRLDFVAFDEACDIRIGVTLAVDCRMARILLVR